jgi:neutral ceramidase
MKRIARRPFQLPCWLTFWLAGCVGLTPLVLFGAAAPEWKAGVATVSLNPELPMWMSGYGGRPGPTSEIVLALKAKALAIEHSSGQRLVIVTTDLLGIPRVLRQSVGEQVTRRFGLPDDALMINASHTHCGPELRGVETILSRADPARAATIARYQGEVVARLVTIVGQALERLAPAELASSRAQAGFAMNRRAHYGLPPDDPRRGKVPNPDGPVDHDVPVLAVKRPGGPWLALLFGYACHNTTSNQAAFHGDYAGFAQQAIEASFPGATAMFLSGCGGDQNPYPRQTMSKGRTGTDLARLHGQSLALAVEAALAATPRPLTGRLRVAAGTVALPYQPAPTATDLEVRLASKTAATREYAQALLEVLRRDGRLPGSYPYPVQVFRFGDGLTLIGLASEVVVDFSHRLKRELTGRNVWVSAYNNDFMGYIPSRRVWEEGGYEGGGALTYYGQTLYRTLHPNIWDPSVEERIVARVLELDRSLER